MEEKMTKFSNYFDEQIALCDRRGKELLADGRTDEATFEKVKANIFDIFRTVFSVAVKTCEEDPNEVQPFFTKRIEQIPLSWAASYEKAKEHNDGAKMCLEQIKLDTARQIKETFAKIWEENQ